MKNYLQLLLPVFICPFQGFFPVGAIATANCGCRGPLSLVGFLEKEEK